MSYRDSLFSSSPPNDAIDTRRRRMLLGAAALGVLPAHRPAIAQSGVKIRIAYWLTPAALPFYAAVEKGYFKDAGLNVEPVKLVTSAQVFETLRSARVEGSATGTVTLDLAGRELKTPGSLKIIAGDASDPEHVLDAVLVRKDSPFKSVADLKGKTVGSWPERHNLAICMAILEKNGVNDAVVSALPTSQHVSMIDNRRIDAVYTFEPNITSGRIKGISRVLEQNVVAKYALGDPKAAWCSGAATLTSDFIAKYPAETRKYLEAYRRGVTLVRKEPAEARRLLKGYMVLDDALIAEMALPAFTMHDEFVPSKVAMFQKYIDFLASRKMLDAQVSVAPMIYKDKA